MDEHESLTGHEAEGIRIIGAVEAGPSQASSTPPNRQPPSAPSAPSAPSGATTSPWEPGEESDEWDDSWLAGDGDLDADHPAPAPRPLPVASRVSQDADRAELSDDDRTMQIDDDYDDEFDDEFDDDDSTGEHPNLWGSAATPASPVQAASPWTRPVPANDGEDRGARDSYEDDAYSYDDHHDDDDDDRDNHDDDDDDDDDDRDGRDDRDDRDGRDDDHDDRDDHEDRVRRSDDSRDAVTARPAGRAKKTLLIGDGEDDVEPLVGVGGGRGRRKSANPDPEPGRRGAGTRTTEPRRRSGVGPVEPGVAAGGNRVVTGLALIVVAALVIKFGEERGVVFLAVLAGVAALLELFTALRQRGFLPAIIHGLVATATLPIAAYLRGSTGVVVVFVLSVLVFCLWFLFGPARDRPVVNIAVSMLGLLYVGFFVSIVGLIVRGNPGTGVDGKRGVALFVGALIGAAVHDIAGLFIGKNLGRVPIAPEVSPNKTVEGLVGGVLCAMAAAALFGFMVEPLKGNTPSIAVFALIIGLLAPLGDLVESMMKRDLGIKDMGSMLPGHGGVLDRIDAMLFVMPGVYLLALAKGWVG